MFNLSKLRRHLSDRLTAGGIALFALVVLATACMPSDAREYAERSPSMDVIGVPVGDEETVNDYYSELYAQAEEQIVLCMAAQGFQYLPFDHSQIDLGAEPITETLEYAEEHGFGIATLDPAADVPEGMISELEDPNTDYISSLSDREREAYFNALAGPGNESAADSCQGKAFDQAFPFIAVFEEFGYDDGEVRDFVDADPRVVEEQSQWNLCMAEAGYAYINRAAAESDILDRLGSLLDDRGAFANDDVRPQTERQIDLLAAEERGIAVASWHCTEPLRELKITVEREYEQAFIDEHGVAIRAALEG